MGKRYQSELEQLPDTYRWAMAATLDASVAPFQRCFSRPLICVGSGGSFTSAAFAASLHQRYTGQPAKAVTPLEAVLSTPNLRRVAVAFFSAGGSNPDVLGAFQRIASREPAELVTVCAQTDTPLAKLAARFPSFHLLDFDLPHGKDGFLATNSLLGTAVILARIYNATYPNVEPLPAAHSSLVTAPFSLPTDDALSRQAELLWEKSTISVLYSPSTQPAAIDLESKFTEAALGNIQLSDYRNFAHGRHHWLAKNGASTAIISLVTDDVRQLAGDTLSLIPRDIPTLSLQFGPPSVQATLSAIVHAFSLVGSAGRARGIDPGRPKVPEFGRQIYHMRAFSIGSIKSAISGRAALAIERKSGEAIDSLRQGGELHAWETAYRSFCDSLTSASYKSVVLDYDGTLCEAEHRFTGLSSVVREHLRRLIRAGVVVGIATGRGRSARDQLRASIDPSDWEKVIVGYYNGADIGTLAEDAIPLGGSVCDPALEPIQYILRDDSFLKSIASIECRRMQITIEPVRRPVWQRVWEHVNALLAASGEPYHIYHSSHTMDVLAPGVSKCRVVDSVRAITPGGAVLCIGDQGRWPGNDFELLSDPLSLSVDEVSADPTTCWNLSSAGRRCSYALDEYLSSLKTSKGIARFVLPPSWEDGL